jgi:hypothetical protein
MLFYLSWPISMAEPLATYFIHNSYNGCSKKPDSLCRFFYSKENAYRPKLVGSIKSIMNFTFKLNPNFNRSRKDGKAA